MSKSQLTGKSGKHSISSELLKRKLPEWADLESLLPDLEKFGSVSVLGSTKDSKYELPLVAFSFGSRKPEAPVLGLFSGVHGLERIGAQVCLSLLRSMLESLLWDQVLHETLKQVRVVFFPMINPLGMFHLRRANPNGVDLMRNAPIEGLGKIPWLLGGQRLSNKLPWYRGGSELEIENQAVLKFCEDQFFQSKAAVTIDFHSGFGMQDRLWFPYAKTIEPFPHLPYFYALKTIFERTYPNHVYRIEPQALSYTTHGDLWDYIYQLYCEKNPGVYLPLALEMGSWQWVKKNPLQIFNPLGPFNPLKPHRQKRILRRHLTLFDFLLKAMASHRHWAEMNTEQKNKNQSQALETWYSGNRSR